MAAPTYGKYSFYAPVKPKPKPKVYPAPTGYAPGGVTYAPPAAAPAAPAARPFMGAEGPAPAAPASVWNPNAYLDQLRGDPMYGSALETFANALKGARTGLRGSIQEAVIRSGFDPSSKLTGDLAGYAADIDEQTRQSAATNQLSQRALLEQGLARNTKNLSYANAARGGLRSGMTTAGVSRLTRENQIATNDAMNQLGDAIRGGITGFQGVESQLSRQRDDAIEAIASRLAQLQGPAPDFEAPAETAAPSAPGAVPGVNYGANSFYTPAAGAVQWGGQQFNTKAAMARWLSARGANFQTWAGKYPQLAARLS